ncbi:arginine N-succinyltransferase [Ideonella sp.]|uniref:arginine N-succinyltransferase n=1 Tax=Ideonella sp. TaxID=1929293 RepID=UPI003BB70CE9
MPELTCTFEPSSPHNGSESAWTLLACRDQAVVGRVELHLNTGARHPRHWYHLGTVVHAAPDLGINHRQPTLQLGNDLTGAAELHGLRCEPGVAGAAEQAAVLDALIDAALVWLARQPAPPARVFAELPGNCDAQGLPPFWQGLGQHFFPYTPAQAERKFGPVWTQEVAALLPRHPLLLSFLSEAAQAAVSACAPQCRAQAEALSRHGLLPGQHIGVIDGGPVHEAWLAALPACRRASTPA